MTGMRNPTLDHAMRLLSSALGTRLAPRTSA
jgi:hypothetical protein